MGTHFQSVSLQQTACRTLAALCINCPRNQGSIAKAGGIRAVVHAMQAHRFVDGVQEWGCTALYNLACHKASQTRIAEEGGVVAIVRAMRDHEASLVVAEQGLIALRTLGFQNEPNKQLIRDEVRP